jgi:hypothetical protein
MEINCMIQTGATWIGVIRVLTQYDLTVSKVFLKMNAVDNSKTLTATASPFSIVAQKN